LPRVRRVKDVMDAEIIDITLSWCRWMSDTICSSVKKDRPMRRRARGDALLGIRREDIVSIVQEDVLLRV